MGRVTSPCSSAQSLGPTAEARRLRERLLEVDAQSCPRRFNFHMHTVCSDGRLKPAEVMQQAVEIGLVAMAITDHHTIRGYLEARSWLEDYVWKRGRRAVPQLTCGVEINACLAGIEVHLLGYGFLPEHPAMRPYLQHRPPRGEDHEAGAVVEAIRQAGGLSLLAHPARYRRDAHDLIREAAELGIDGIETYYAYDNPDPWIPSPMQTERVRSIVDSYGLLHSCGTDTHGTSLLQRL